MFQGGKVKACVKLGTPPSKQQHDESNEDETAHDGDWGQVRGRAARHTLRQRRVEGVAVEATAAERSRRAVGAEERVLVAWTSLRRGLHGRLRRGVVRARDQQFISSGAGESRRGITLPSL